MSYASLARKFEAKGRIKLRGGQCEGRVEGDRNVTVDMFTESRGKGVEYAAKYREEEEKAYLEMMTTTVNQGMARMDVTSNQGLSQMDLPEELTSIGTVPNYRELDREELTQVYKRYNFDPVEPSEHLETIYSEREQIVRLIEQNQVCVIKGPTGCGKSTQIPQFILDHYAAQQRHCNIVVTQPRRIAAISIAQRVCKERNWGEPGGLIGYQVGLDKKADEDTRILYCTTGVLLEKLINSKNLNEYTHIILDEVHEREEDMDFLMLIVRKFLRTNLCSVKVVLMSATIDVSRFAEYFGPVIRGQIVKAPAYEIKRESKFQVQVYYLDALTVLGNVPEVKEEEPGISKEAYELVPMMIRAFNQIDAEDFRCRRSTEKKGAVLIFLPGLHQIETLHEILWNEDRKQKQDSQNPDVFNLWLCPLHSSITRDEQEKVVNFAPPGTRKVILSTNIAESSLTIPDVKYVIDFCLTKHLVADTNTGFTSLQMAWASHTNCAQREGRVGRVQDGRVYRMVPKNFYQFKMSKDAVPEMRRCPLDIVVLKCKRLIEDECPLKLISVALDPPDLDNYEKTILKLKEVGAMLTTCRGRNDPEDGDLTFMGRVMGSLPLDIRITKLILLGHVFGVLEETIIMGCAMVVRNLFSEPFQARLEAYNNKLLWADSSESDAVAYLNAYLVWRSLTGLGKFERSRRNEDSWARMYMLQIKSLREVSLQEADIKKRLRYFNIEPVRHHNKPLWTKEEKPLILKLVLAGAFYPNYYSCSAENPNSEIEAVKMLGGKSPYECVYLQNMPQPAPLYYDQVRDIFHRYDVSKNFELYCDGSQKVVVQFSKPNMIEHFNIGDRDLTREIPGDIPLPVYRAIKMRQLSIPMSIRVYPPSIAQEKMNAYELRTSMMPLNSHTSDYRPVIDWNQGVIEIMICHVVEAGQFYGQILPSTMEKLKRVDQELNKSKQLCELSGEVEEGAVYAAPYKDEGELVPRYYRAKVINKYEEFGRHYVNVFFIDYGNTALNMPVKELREIFNEDAQQRLNEIPPLAVKFELAEVSPSHWNNHGGRWCEQANNFVKQTLLTENNNTWLCEVYSYVNGTASVFLLLEEEGRDGKPPLTLNELLVSKNFARRREESYLSKRNHARRQEISKSLEPFDNPDGTRPLNTDMKLLPFSEVGNRHLKGPHSPLEMKLYCKTKSCVKKDVRVEWNSVNSVLLDSDPTDPHERLLVAGFVSQTADKRKLSLNHTTVLPGIDGLAALVCLMFAPSVELRSDEYRSRYIGALCGLGCDSETGEPLYPENDMEIKFDVEFQEEDLLNVNKVRFHMNRRFSGPESEDMPESAVVTIQKQIKELIKKLIRKPRPSVKVEYYRSPYRWGQVPDRYLLAPFEDVVDDETLTMCVYKLNPAIELNPANDVQYITQLVKKYKALLKCVREEFAPRELVCELCDLDFSYWVQLRDHVESSHHHQQLVRWLRGRATAHGLSIDLPPPPPPQPNIANGPPKISRPSTSAGR